MGVSPVTASQLAAFNSGTNVSPSQHLKPGFFLLEWVGFMPGLGVMTVANIEYQISTWVFDAVNSPEWVGQVGDVSYEYLGESFIGNGEANIRVLVPVYVDENDTKPTLSNPLAPQGIVPLIPLVGWLLVSLTVAAVGLELVMVLTPGQPRQLAATVGLLFHPDSEALQDISEEPLPPSNVSKFILGGLALAFILKFKK